jgi:hypothetical protein
VPAANGSSSKAPIGAVPEDRAGLGDDLAVALGRARADVEAHPPVGDVDAVELLGLGAGVEAATEDEVLREHEPVAALGDRALGGSIPSASHSDAPTEWTAAA